MKAKFLIIPVGLIITMGAVAWGMNWIDIGNLIQDSEPQSSQYKKEGGGKNNDGNNPGESECLKMVRSAYHHISETGKDGGITRVRYAISSTATVMGKVATTKADIELLVAENRLQMTGGPMEVWQDEQVKVTLIPNRGLIYVGDTDPRRFKQAQSPLALALQDSLLAISQLEQCIEEKGNDGTILKHVELRLPEPFQTQARVSDIRITVNPANQMVQRVRVQYLPSSQIQEMEMNIHSIETNFQTDLFDQPVLLKFFDKQGTVRPEYAEYKIMDVRVKKAK